MDTCILSHMSPIKPKSSDPIEIIKRIGRLHDQLCTIMDNINLNYSFQVILVK